MSLWSRLAQRRVRDEAQPPPGASTSPAEPSESDAANGTPLVESLPGLVDHAFDELFGTGSARETAGPKVPSDGASEPSAAGSPVESSFGAVTTPDASGTPDDDPAGPVHIFSEITRAYIAPVQRFVCQLRAGPYSSLGLEMHRPAMEMVARAAERLPVGDLVPRIDRLSAALLAAVESGEPTIAGTLRSRILDAYAALERALPSAFRIDDEARPVDDVILISLLRQIPDVGTVTLDKLFGVGLTTVDMFAEATPRDLAVTAGISESLATRICVRVHGYLVARKNLPDAAARAESVARLATLIGELRDLHDAYEALRKDDRVRWAHRRRRLDVALQVDLALAELSERALVEQLQTLSFEKRIDRLVRYVESLGGKIPRRIGR